MNHIITFDPSTDLNESGGTHSHGCLMVVPQLSNGFWNGIIKTIRQEDLHTEVGSGIENEPHVTVLYEFLPSIKTEAIVKHARTIKGPLTLWASNVSIFDNSPDYDVLKFDIFSKNLIDLNKSFRVFPNENKYPKYHPHMTIAYLKKGMAQKYTNAIFTKEIPFECTSNKLLYSSPDGSKTKIII